MKIAVLGAGVVGVTSAWYLAEAGHEVTVLERQPQAGMETSFANGGQISAGHAEPWAKPAALAQILRWLGREDAPLLFRPRADLAQWEWGLRFLFECLPGRFERHCRELAGLAAYSRDCLGQLRDRTGIQYHALSRGILHFCTDRGELERPAEDERVDVIEHHKLRRDFLLAEGAGAVDRGVERKGPERRAADAEHKHGAGLAPPGAGVALDRFERLLVKGEPREAELAAVHPRGEALDGGAGLRAAGLQVGRG